MQALFVPDGEVNDLNVSLLPFYGDSGSDSDEEGEMIHDMELENELEGNRMHSTLSEEEQLAFEHMQEIEKMIAELIGEVFQLENQSGLTKKITSLFEE